ncbi:MAG TPA: efflux RND transporter periplasmic adaptor subunit, partial [Edaphobacter sp.]|nr:efflux RND transporter periplasmic adaptor subunit [Edaphobacter sp.]
MQKLRRNSIHSGRLRPLIAILCLGVLLSGCKKTEDVAPPVVSVQAEKVERKPLTAYVSGEAVLMPQAQAAIVPKISAPIQKFLIQRGSRVKKGQLLAVLENADLAAAVHDSQGALKQADASYATTTKAGVVEDLQKAQLDLAQARANLDLQQNIVDSRQTLLQQGAIPRRDLDTAQAALVQAKAAYDIASQHLNSLKSVSQTATIHGAEGARESAQGKYEEAEAALSYSEVRSPIDGVVTDRPLYAGEMANAGQAIVTVMDTSSLLAKVHLSPQQTVGLTVGDDAVLTFTGQDQPAHGRITLISPALDAGSTTLEVWVTVPNKSGAYKAGTPVHVSLAARTLPDAVTVPNQAIIATRSGTPAVMVVDAGSVAHQKEVR